MNSTNDNRRDDLLSRLYRASARETPPEALDADILARARAAASGSEDAARTRRRRVAASLSAAAVIVLSIGVALKLAAPLDPEALDEQARLHAAFEQAPAAAPDAAKAEAPAAKREMSTARAAAQAPGAAALSMADAQTARDAAVVSVRVEGEPGAYWFAVGVRSDDTGCEHYADWWEIVGEDGKLLYRYVYLHSHVGEQPFVRSGGPVAVAADVRVYIRVHMNRGGYSSAAFAGSVRNGFAPTTLSPTFAAGLAAQAPLPSACEF